LVGSRYNSLSGDRSGSAWAYAIKEVRNCVDDDQPAQDKPGREPPLSNLSEAEQILTATIPTIPELESEKTIPLGDPTSSPLEASDISSASQLADNGSVPTSSSMEATVKIGDQISSYVPTFVPTSSTPTFSPTFTPTVSPSESDLPPLPGTRFLAWSLLSTNQTQIATDLGYTEDTWNLLGSAEIEHLTFYVLDNQQRKAVQSLGMTTEEIWDCHINHYHGYFWSDLVESGLDRHYVALGWNPANWENGSKEPESENKYWASLTPDEMSAAVQLCYTEGIWDEVPIPDWS